MTKTVLKPRFGIEELINQATRDLPARQRDVLDKRFGLTKPKRLTLAELGNSYGVTRERIRQVEAAALKSVSGTFPEKEKIVRFVRNHLESLGGLRRENLFFFELGFLLGAETEPDVFSNRARFLMEILGVPFGREEDDSWHALCYLHGDHFGKAARFVNHLEKRIAGRKEETIDKKKFHEFLAAAAKLYGLKDTVALNYLSVSRKFHVNPYGDFGLAVWPEIAPKRIKDKAYLVLKKTGGPLHFRDLAAAINAVKFNNRKAYPQTVHNELIKDPRFVLVGRGLYGLKEHGFSPGTALETLKRIIKRYGPMTASRAVDIVAREKFFKKNTVLLNLQNKKHFKKLGDGRFALVSGKK